MANQHTPNLVCASGTIGPYRAVAPTGAGENSANESNANNLSIGVTSGDTKAHDSTEHAEAGDQISLQTGNVLMIEAGGAITRGGGIMTDAEGRAVAATPDGATLIYHLGVALETAGGAGEIIRMIWMPQAIRPALS